MSSRRILDVNRQACESLGYSRDEMIGMHPRDFDAGLDEASIARIGERVTSGETVTFETLHRRKDGTVFPVEVRARQFQQERMGSDYRWRATSRNASARRKCYARVKPSCRRRSGSRILAGGSGTSAPIACLFRTRFAGSSEWILSISQNGTRAG